MEIQLIKDLFENGVLTKLYRAGLISTKVFDYWEIFNWVHGEVNCRGISFRRAVVEASVKFNKDERTIWRALKAFDADTSMSA